MIWCACQEFGINPPGFPKQRGKLRWDELSPYHQAHLIAFYQTKQHEAGEHELEMLKATQPKTAVAKRGRRKK